MPRDLDEAPQFFPRDRNIEAAMRSLIPDTPQTPQRVRFIRGNAALGGENLDEMSRRLWPAEILRQDRAARCLEDRPGNQQACGWANMLERRRSVRWILCIVQMPVSRRPLAEHTFRAILLGRVEANS